MPKKGFQRRLPHITLHLMRNMMIELLVRINWMTMMNNYRSLGRSRRKPWVHMAEPLYEFTREALMPRGQITLDMEISDEPTV